MTLLPETLDVHAGAPRRLRNGPAVTAALVIACLVALPVAMIFMLAALGTDGIWPHLIANVIPKALGTTLWLLALFPDDQERLRDEILRVAGDAPLEARHVEALDGVRAAIMESMRLYPPAPAHLRDCLRDTELCGVRIRKGTLVTIPLYAVHRHRKLWEEPDAFRPERFAGMAITDKALRGRYTPFGGGPRICLGMHFAMAEMVTVTANLLRAFRFDEVPGFEPGFAVGAGFYPKDGLKVTVTPL